MANSLVNKDSLSVESNISDAVLNQVNTLTSENRLITPKNYVAANALQSAFLMISQKYPAALQCEVGSKEYLSLQQTLLEMVTMGLNPMKNQCYFIPRGNVLTLFKSYFGDVAAAKNSGLIKDVRAVVIYKDDNVEVAVENGRRIVKSHTTAFGNEDGEIKGAYCVVEKTNGELEYTIMTKKELDRAWAQTSTHDSKFQKGFPQEAAKRTVIRRAIKLLMNSSTDESLVVEAYNHITSQEYNENDDVDNTITIQVEPVAEEKKETKKATKKAEKKVEEPKIEVVEEVKAEVVEEPKTEPVKEEVKVEVVEEPKTEVAKPTKNILDAIKKKEKKVVEQKVEDLSQINDNEPPFVENTKIASKPEVVGNEPENIIKPETVVKRVEVKSSSSSNKMASILDQIKNMKKGE